MTLKTNYHPSYASVLKRLVGILLLSIALLATSLSVSGQTQPGASTRHESAPSLLPNSTSLRGSSSANFTATNSSSWPLAVEAAAEATLIEKRAFDLTNTVRTENGRAPLTWDVELCHLARGYSQKMATLGFFAHVEPDGSDLRDRARTAGIHYRAIGENIAYNRGFEDPGASTVQRWMDSSAHRSNLLGREYRASAVGVFVSPEGRVYITQLFIKR